VWAETEAVWSVQLDGGDPQQVAPIDANGTPPNRLLPARPQLAASGSHVALIGCTIAADAVTLDCPGGDSTHMVVGTLLTGAQSDAATD